jgi:voltage-gated potassium channel
LGKLRRRLILSLALIVFIVSFGTIGYMVVEGWNFQDSLYMTVTTLTTVGYREVRELTSVGRWFTIILIIGGVGTMLYALSTGAKVLLEGEIKEALGRRRLEKKIRELRDHYIICGYGRMGKIIVKELKSEKVKFVVIEKNAISQEKEEAFLIIGDATQDELLKEVGIERAKGLITVLPTDAENLYVVLSAKGLNQKLLRAGADRVISPYHIGGLRIAHTVLKPAVVDFIELATQSGNIDLQLEEIPIPDVSRFSGLSLDQCGFGKDLGIIIVGIKKTSGDMQFNPTYRTLIEPGDTLIALGETSKLKVLEEMIAPRK